MKQPSNLMRVFFKFNHSLVLWISVLAQEHGYENSIVA
jgi:hypothetical protein